jgi:hypothetical protein
MVETALTHSLGWADQLSGNHLPVAFQRYHFRGVAQTRGQINPSTSKNGAPMHALYRLRLALKNENSSPHVAEVNIRP